MPIDCGLGPIPRIPCNDARLHFAVIHIDEKIQVALVVFEPVVVLLLHLLANGERG
jgi:hypothetical protein